MHENLAIILLPTNPLGDPKWPKSGRICDHWMAFSAQQLTSKSCLLRHLVAQKFHIYNVYYHLIVAWWSLFVLTKQSPYNDLQICHYLITIWSPNACESAPSNDHQIYIVVQHEWSLNDHFSLNDHLVALCWGYQRKLKI